MSTTVSKELKMKWQTEAGDDIGVNLNEPLDTLDSETVLNAMNAIIDQNVLQDGNGNAAAITVAASIVETTVNETVLF